MHTRLPDRGGTYALLTTVCLLASLTPSLAEDRLPSRTIDVPFAAVPENGPWSFDLIDFREEERLARVQPRADTEPHTFFVVKFGFSFSPK